VDVETIERGRNQFHLAFESLKVGSQRGVHANHHYNSTWGINKKI